MATPAQLSELFGRGWALVPIRAGQKAPTDAKWPTTVYKAASFQPDDNVGVKCGEPSGWLVDTDCDCPEAVIAAAELMPETGLVHGRASRQRSHHWYTVAQAETKKYTDLDSKMLIETRSTGAQTVIPPSVHPSGEPIVWDNDGAPLSMDLADYTRAIQMTAVATLLARHWPSGARHEVAGHIAGFLCRLGFSATETAKVVGTAAKIAGDEEWQDRERLARDTARKHEAGERTTGTPKLVESLPDGKAIVAKVYGWLGRKGDEFLDALNKRHFVVQLGTDVVVGSDDDEDAGVTFHTFEQFKKLHYAQRVGKTRLGEWWLSNPAQRRFRKVVFKPPPLRALPDDYNLWKGFTLKPDAEPQTAEARCGLFLSHLFEVMCDGNRDYFDYLLNVFAITVQQPGQPSGVAVVWRGDQGAGKGTVMELFGSLFGQHYAHLSSANALTGDFNDHLSGKVVVFADEAVWGGSKRDAGELKRLVTEKTISVHRKHLARVEEPNCIHLYLATNEEWVWPVSLRERRGFILDVELKPYQNAQYFQDIRDEWEEGGGAAFLALCQHRAIPGGRLGPVPRTEALVDQFELSMSFVQQWWNEKLLTGEFAPGKGWPDFLAGGEAFEDFLRIVGQTGGWSRKKTESQVISELKKLLPPDLARVRRLVPVNTARYGEAPRWEKMPRVGWVIPPLETCRTTFDRKTGIPRKWPEPLSVRDPQQMSMAQEGMEA